MAAPQHANARPGSCIDSGPALKLHRRLVRLRGRDHTVLTLRPGARARYSTNYFHDTWHLLSDAHGARVLARLLWGLSYQARPGTIVLLDATRLDPNPFDAEPAMPVALVPAGLTACTARLLREVRRSSRLRRPPAGTVRWRTHGLDLAVARTRRRRYWQISDAVERVVPLGGVLAIVADPARLRALAVEAARLPKYWYGGQSYMEIDYPNGEVQIWRDYHRMVSIARTARAEVLADPGASVLGPPDLRPMVWRHGTVVRRRRYGPPRVR